jgi:hypothetical protein
MGSPATRPHPSRAACGPSEPKGKDESVVEAAVVISSVMAIPPMPTVTMVGIPLVVVITAMTVIKCAVPAVAIPSTALSVAMPSTVPGMVSVVNATCERIRIR